MASTSSSRSDVASTIMRYLAAHPEACDSLEGICAWWLVRQRLDDARSDVAAALADLVASGELAASTGPGGQTVYHAILRPVHAGTGNGHAH